MPQEAGVYDYHHHLNSPLRTHVFASGDKPSQSGGEEATAVAGGEVGAGIEHDGGTNPMTEKDAGPRGRG